MKILAIDSSGLTASVAIVTEDAVLAEYNTNFKKTHSQTLLPMIDSIMSMTGIGKSELDAVAVAKGPGSFTGLRIGAGTAKGIALALNIPIIPVSTLEALAWTFSIYDGPICPVMDARRAQLYSAVYRFEDTGTKVLCSDAARSYEEVVKMLNTLGEEVILTGDGLTPASDFLKTGLKVPFRFASVYENRQRAAVLGDLALKRAEAGEYTDPDRFAPVYLRPSQAERVRRKKESESQ